MSLRSSISSGISMGATFGLIGAAASLIFSGGAVLMIVPTLAGGTFFGAATGGVLGASAHLFTHSSDTMRHVMGARKEGASPRDSRVDYRTIGRGEISQGDMEKIERDVFAPDHVRDQEESWRERVEAEREAVASQQMGR